MNTLAAFEFPPVSHLFEWPEIFLKDTPFAVNKTVLLMWAAVLITGVIFIMAARGFQRVPGKFQALVESIVNFIDQGIVGEVMGPKGRSWTPFLTSLFMFIFLLNLFEVIPPINFPSTSRMAIPLILALLTWVLFIFVGFKNQGFKYVPNMIFPPGVPKPLYVLITPIEIVSNFIVRPFSLAVRLFANLFAGHLLLTVFFLLTAAMWTAAPNAVILPVPFAAAVALTAFELLVSLLQAYIFTILTAVYIADSMEAHH